MKELRSLASQTAIYGLSSILPRFLNYLLVFFHTRIFNPDEYGVITEFYAYATFLLIILTYGLETGFFRFFEKEESKKELVYSSSLITIFSTSFLFILACIFFAGNLASLIGYPENKNFVIYFAIILSIDAFTSIPFARLRQQNKAFKFAFVKILSVLLNVFFNIFFLYIIPTFNLISNFNPHVGYVFLSNLIASAFTLLFLYKEIFKIKLFYDFILIKKILRYSLPLLFAGLIGNINETLDRILLKYFIPEAENPMYQLGIYGANIKVAVLMVLFVQMYRYAFEPFLFKNEKKENSKFLMAEATRYFVIFSCLILVFINNYLDIFKYMVGKNYWDGLFIIPILLFANLFYGILINLSVWYKLSDKTKYGAIMAIAGALITIIVNIVFIPKIGYLASALSRLICYFSMVILSYYLGQKYYKVPYNIKNISFYILLSLGIILISNFVPFYHSSIKIVVNTLLFGSLIIIVEFKEKIIRKMLKKI